MKKTIFLSAAMILFTTAALTSCNPNEPKKDDPTKFSTSSIVGLWACVGSDIKEYDPDAGTYTLYWYFNIQNDSKVQYINAFDTYGEFRKSDSYIHVKEGSEWIPMIDANNIFDVEHQAIRCPSGTVLGFTLESVADLLGNDTIFYVQRNGLDEAQIFDNTGWIQDQYVIRAKGIKTDLQ